LKKKLKYGNEEMEIGQLYCHFAGQTLHGARDFVFYRSNQ